MNRGFGDFDGFVQLRTVDSVLANLLTYVLPMHATWPVVQASRIDSWLKEKHDSGEAETCTISLMLVLFALLQKMATQKVGSSR